MNTKNLIRLNRIRKQARERLHRRMLNNSLNNWRVREASELLLRLRILIEETGWDNDGDTRTA